MKNIMLDKMYVLYRTIALNSPCVNGRYKNKEERESKQRWLNENTWD
jgi:hypothetical protein